MYYVYILLSKKDGKLYMGYTGDILRRIREHNRGGTKSTKRRRPLVLVYYEAHLSSKDARRREKYFKTNKGKSSLRQMVRNDISLGKEGTK